MHLTRAIQQFGSLAALSLVLSGCGVAPASDDAQRDKGLVADGQPSKAVRAQDGKSVPTPPSDKNWEPPDCMKRESDGASYDKTAPRRLLTFDIGAVRPGGPKSAVTAFACAPTNGDPDDCLYQSPDGAEYSVGENIVSQIDVNIARAKDITKLPILPWGLHWGDPLETSASKMCSQDAGTWFIRETGVTGYTIFLSREEYSYIGDATPITISVFFKDRKLSGLLLGIAGWNEQQSEN